MHSSHEERNARCTALVTNCPRPISFHGTTVLDLFTLAIDDDPGAVTKREVVVWQHYPFKHWRKGDVDKKSEFFGQWTDVCPANIERALSSGAEANADVPSPTFQREGGLAEEI